MDKVKQNKPRTHLYLEDRKKGMTYREIAKKHGVSYQAVAQACARRGVGHFKPYSADDVPYPYLRAWLNENQISRAEFARRLDKVPYGASMEQVSTWLRGRCYPSKKIIDKILAVTGLTYEELFAEEGEA